MAGPTAALVVGDALHEACSSLAPGLEAQCAGMPSYLTGAATTDRSATGPNSPES